MPCYRSYTIIYIVSSVWWQPRGEPLINLLGPLISVKWGIAVLRDRVWGCFATLTELLKWVFVTSHFREYKQYTTSCGVVCFWNQMTAPHQPLRWRHNEHDGVSNHQPHDCLLNVCLGEDQRKHQSSESLAFVRGIHRWLVNSPHKGPVTRKMFSFNDVTTTMRRRHLIS